MVAVARPPPKSGGRANWFADREIPGRAGVSSASLRLVTFDRRGHRRLGALLEGKVVDRRRSSATPPSPRRWSAWSGATGHRARCRPCSPRARRGGRLRRRSTAPARRAAPRVAAIRGRRGGVAARVRTRGDDPVARGRRMARVPPEDRGVLRRPVGDALGPEEAPPPSSATRWSPTGSRGARAATRSPRRRASHSIGPCVVTTDEIDPQTTFVTVRVDGEEWVKGN